MTVSAVTRGNTWNRIYGRWITWSNGGAWDDGRDTEKQCDFISRIRTPELPPLLDIPDPRLPVLEKAVTRVWSSTVYEWTSGEEPA
jgi:hypothetical protein